MSVLKRIFMILVGVNLLAACSGDIGQVIGLNKETPDEFTVVTRAPLVLPPDFGIRPPDPRDKRAEEDRAKDTAQAALFGLANSRKKRQALADLETKFQGGELALLKQADAVSANSDIREIVDSESNAIALANEGFMDDLLFWKDDPGPGIVIDADSENARLTENAGLGKPVTDGDTPMIRRSGEGSLF